jgi:hypothetical protein
MVLVLEARNRVVGLLLQDRARDAAALLGLEQRQAPPMDEIVDERGDEHGLAGARQSGHADAQRGQDDVARPPGDGVQCDAGLIADGGQ